MSDETLSWYTVRCAFASDAWVDEEGSYRTYEERVTLWRASSADEAIERAEADAEEYAASVSETPVSYLGLAQCFHLFDEPVDGAEVFSLMRDSDLDPDDYVDSFFDTGAEHRSDVDEDADEDGLDVDEDDGHDHEDEFDALDLDD